MKLTELKIDPSSETKEVKTEEKSKESKVDIEEVVDEEVEELEEDLYTALDLLRGCLSKIDHVLWLDRVQDFYSITEREEMMELNADLITFLEQWEE